MLDDTYRVLLGEDGIVKGAPDEASGRGDILGLLEPSRVRIQEGFADLRREGESPPFMVGEPYLEEPPWQGILVQNAIEASRKIGGIHRDFAGAIGVPGRVLYRHPPLLHM